MKLSQLLITKCYDTEQLEMLGQALVKIPFLSKYSPEEITLNKLEKAMRKLEDKYPVMLGYITSMPRDDKQDAYYSFMVKDSSTHEWIQTIYAISMYEGFAKTVLLMYAYSRKIRKDTE